MATIHFPWHLMGDTHRRARACTRTQTQTDRQSKRELLLTDKLGRLLFGLLLFPNPTQPDPTQLSLSGVFRAFCSLVRLVRVSVSPKILFRPFPLRTHLKPQRAQKASYPLGSTQSGSQPASTNEQFINIFISGAHIWAPLGDDYGTLQCLSVSSQIYSIKDDNSILSQPDS